MAKKYNGFIYVRPHVYGAALGLSCCFFFVAPVIFFRILPVLILDFGMAEATDNIAIKTIKPFIMFVLYALSFSSYDYKLVFLPTETRAEISCQILYT